MKVLDLIFKAFRQLWLRLNGMIGGIKKVGGDGRTPNKLTHTMFVSHKAHMDEQGSN